MCSSLALKWAHNPKVEGSNPSPATNALIRFQPQSKGKKIRGLTEPLVVFSGNPLKPTDLYESGQLSLFWKKQWMTS